MVKWDTDEWKVLGNLFYCEDVLIDENNAIFISSKNNLIQINKRNNITCRDSAALFNYTK